MYKVWNIDESEGLNMTLSELTVSLDIARELRDSGFPQDTYAAWVSPKNEERYHLNLNPLSAKYGCATDCIAAPTAEELGALFPATTDRDIAPEQRTTAAFRLFWKVVGLRIPIRNIPAAIPGSIGMRTSKKPFSSIVMQ
jgi:hypothetical protein